MDPEIPRVPLERMAVIDIHNFPSKMVYKYNVSPMYYEVPDFFRKSADEENDTNKHRLKFYNMIVDLNNQNPKLKIK